MSTAELIDGVASSPRAHAERSDQASRAALRLPLLIGGALLVVVLYAAFDHAAVGLSAETRVEVAIAAITAVAAAAALALHTLHLSASRTALVGLTLLAAFAGWSGITLIWSVAPDQTWIELNRAISYVLVLTIAIALGASHPHAPMLLAKGFLAVALAVTAYALGQKLVPGLHISGIFDLNQTGSIPRLQAPLGYWNALALFVVLAVPIGLQLMHDQTRSRRARFTAAAATQLMLLTIGLTLSRGGLLALAVALTVSIAGAREKLRAVGWLALAVLATLPPLAFGLTSHSLTNAGVGLGSRETAGAILAAVLAASLAALILGGRMLLKIESRLRTGQVAARRIRRIGVAALSALVIAGVVAVATTNALHGFTSPHPPSNVSPNRLLTTDSYRWLWWKEAASAFAARPVGGWGAGSFGVLHLIYRKNTLPVQQPHSVPLQFLSETGIVGALLGIGALTLLMLAAARSARRRELSAAERGIATALLAGAAAYAVHILYDWDWNIPAVTLPALMFSGVLVGASRTSRVGSGTMPRGPRPLALILATLWLCLFAFSAVLPRLAASKASSALIEASSASPADLAAAQAKAKLASSLDPLSDAGLRAEASIALHRAQASRARYYLEEALRRAPSDELAWNELADVDYYFLRDIAGARVAAQRVLTLDPRGPDAQALRKARLLAAQP